MRVIIAGTRHFDNYDLLKETCDHLLSKIKSDIEIVSGCARGADRLGEQYAEECGYSVKKFPADWEKYHKAAGYVRNKEMAEYADTLIAFWDGTSKGTKHMINLARKSGLKVKICNY